MIMIMMMIIIVMIIPLKGANSRFLQSSHCSANCLQLLRSTGPCAILCKSCATNLALITCNMSCITWYDGITQLSSLTELKPRLL